MTPQEYFDYHIPHRVNLLIAFRERYSGRNEHRAIDPELYRDLFRCSKDISMLMVRFLLSEVGIRLPRRQAGVPDCLATCGTWPSPRGIEHLSVDEIKADSRYSSVFTVLRAANRAVAHIEPGDVDHPIRTDADLGILVNAIDYVEEIVAKKIYAATGHSLLQVMTLQHNRI